MKKTFLTLALSGILNLFSGSLLGDSDWLNKVEKTYQDLAVWEIPFEQTSHIQTLDQDFTKKGLISVHLPDHLRIAYFSEPRKIYIYNGKILWIYNQDLGEAQEFQKPQHILSAEALSFLGGFHNLSDFFAEDKAAQELTQPFQITEKKLKTITLAPKDEGSPILQLVLGIELKSFFVREAILANVSGNITYYRFENIKLKKTLDPELFTLPKSVKVQIMKGI